MKAYALKAYIRQQGCELRRIGRSRHWLLSANFEQLQSIITFIEHSNEPSWVWLTKLLKNKYQHLSHDELLSIASSIQGLTLNTLIARTDCTITQARQVIDELEDLD
jgi:hypothetical protein